MKRAFVTGASGFVGSAVVRALVAQGWTVAALVRSSSPRTNLDVPGIEVVEGDMRDAASVRRAMSGAEAVFHVAADYRLWAPDPEEIVRNNREGTRVVMQAAKAAGVKRIVYTSSVATLKSHDDGQPSDETRPLTPETAIGAYKRSKVMAERLVEEMVAQDGLPAIIVNPSTPIGPRDIRPTPTGRIILEAARGRMPAFVDTGLNLVHVDDVAAGHLLAFDKGRIGERYILGGEEHDAGRHARGNRRKSLAASRRRCESPRGAIFPLAYAAEALARITGKEPFSPSTACGWRNTACFSPAPRPSRARLLQRVPPPKRCVTPSFGSAKPACSHDPVDGHRRASRWRSGCTCSSGTAGSGSRPTATIAIHRPRRRNGPASSPSFPPATRQT